MYGLPSQNVEKALQDLKTAVDYQPAHLSWYQLTVEPNTAFYNKPPELPEEEVVLAMQLQGLEILNAAGLKRYETSAYGKLGKQSKHNLNYWSFGDYIGIGAGAHGKITFPNKNQILRTRKVKQPASYLAKEKNYLAEKTAVTSEDLNLEFMMNALRLTDGFERKLFETRTGNSFSSIGKKIGYLQAEGLLREGKEWIVPSQKGQLFVNSLLEEFL
jgi:putative oxygen-independent coproporphyrinogen III oxidase